MSRVVVVVGTRPEAIKMAPVIHALRSTQWAECRVLLSGQHRALLDQTLEQFGVVADYDLNLMEPDQTLGRLTGTAFTRFDAALRELKPDFVLAQGDTTTAMVAALSCFYQDIPFGHVEAGLRTGNKRMPFPEEVNRRIAGLVADLHFAPTQRAVDALLREGTPAQTIFLTGNTVIDNLARYGPQVSPLALPATERLILLTAHRRENFGEPMRGALQAVSDIVKSFPNVRVLFPVHPNPQVKAIAYEILDGMEHVSLVDPLGYFDFIAAMKASYLVLTDSGGVQEEAPWFSKPVLVLREESERPEAIEVGAAALVGLDCSRIRARLEELLTDRALYATMSQSCSPYGDGLASQRIAEHVGRYLGHAVETSLPPFRNLS
ncbi:MAG: UDP-N-acetylglucosamine 2-epimerase (non-hydrolyzing) [Hyphomonadaceae bacterium]|nr:UDP-N-acetylglucosamine 2-epimerase (non-hydrolyzing) [Hyphomonadaceae bacterium]